MHHYYFEQSLQTDYVHFLLFWFLVLLAFPFQEKFGLVMIIQFVFLGEKKEIFKSVF